MRVLVHDFSGHPFQVELSRALAGRGHEVLHLHCPAYRSGKGALDRRTGDPGSFQIEAVGSAEPWERDAWVRRLRQELRYGAAFTRRAAAFAPHVVLSSNDPLFAKAWAARWCERSRTPWVFWLQDIYSMAMGRHARERLGTLGIPVGRAFEAVERRLLQSAAGVVAITDDFVPVLRRWGIDTTTCTVIENWSPLAELPPRPRDNPWAHAHGLVGPTVALYAGTLGLKHDPHLLSELARRTRDRGLTVVVISEGIGADWLAAERARGALDNLVLLPYQPYEALPDVLASADILLTLLQPEAGVFSVPSKVLTYLCAGRAVVAAMPNQNLAARVIRRSGAGVVVAPGDVEGFLAATEELAAVPERRDACAQSARAFAEQVFDIDRICDTFEGVLDRAARPARCPQEVG